MRLRRAFVEVLKFEAVFKALILFIIAPLLREIYQTYIASVAWLSTKTCWARF